MGRILPAREGMKNVPVKAPSDINRLLSAVDHGRAIADKSKVYVSGDQGRSERLGADEKEGVGIFDLSCLCSSVILGGDGLREHL